VDGLSGKDFGIAVSANWCGNYLAVRLARRFAHMAKPTRPKPTKSIIERSGNRIIALFADRFSEAHHPLASL